MSEIHVKDFAQLKEKFEANTCNKVSQRSVMKNGILNSTQNQVAIGENDFFFSIDVDSEAVANQNKSGRCWMFACLNILRAHIEKQYNVKHFELSQNYTNFYDKLEKANYFHQNIVETANSPLSDRTVVKLLQTPQQDGGDWELIVSIIDKYGVMPKDKMDETHSSIDSSELNTVLNRKLRQDAIILRELVREGATEEKITHVREKMLTDVYQILAVSLGTPPERFDFEYRDLDKKYHIFRDLTAQDFYKDYTQVDLNDYVELINVPIQSMPYNKMYGVELSRNMVNGLPNSYLNVDMDTLKALTIKQLQSGEPVWFACDVLQSSDRQKGIMALDLYDLEASFNIKFTMDKGQRFEYRESLPTHAMVLGGVDLVEGKPTKWKVENSWGDKVGDKGFFVMSDEWMSEYAYAVAVHKDLLDDDLRKVISTEPTILPYWNEMYPL
ncbi:C1 family peptidase [Enterococcus sp. LJL99]